MGEHLVPEDSISNLHTQNERNMILAKESYVQCEDVRMLLPNFILVEMLKIEASETITV